VRVFPKPRPASNNQTCHEPGGGSWFGRAIAGQEASSASASCAANELAILGSLVAPIGKRRPRSAPGIEDAQRRDHGLARLRIGCNCADDPGDRSRINHAWEFSEQTVASILNSMAAVLLDLWINELRQVHLQPLVRALLIRPIRRE